MALKLKKTAIESLKKVKTVRKDYTVLIVDDEVENLRAMVSTLEEDYEIMTAENGQEALEQVKHLYPATKIDVIISDQRMPKMTGVEFLEKSIPLIPKTKRIILTGYTDIEATIDAINKGQVYKFITKPIDPADLKITVKRAIEVQKLEIKNTELIGELKFLNTLLEQKVKERTSELKDAFLTIKAQQDQINEELEDARETQKTLMPEVLPSIPHVNISCKYVPMEQIGGDLYHVFPLEQNHFGLMIADVTGHGPSAALISFMVSAIFSEAREAGLSTKQVMNLVNEKLVGKLQDGKFASLFYGIYDATHQTFTYTSGGHPYALLVRTATSEIISLSTDGLLVGLFSNDMTNFEEKKIQLIPGDKILLFTDAIVESMNQQGKPLGNTSVFEFVKKNGSQPISKLLELIYQLALEYSVTSHLDDDCTMVGMEIISS